jgi:hypothetical protein
VAVERAAVGDRGDSAGAGSHSNKVAVASSAGSAVPPHHGSVFFRGLAAVKDALHAPPPPALPRPPLALAAPDAIEIGTENGAQAIEIA